MYRRILVTGANGLVGQALVARLSQQLTYDVLATGRGDARRGPEASGGYVPLDVTQADDVRRLFLDFTPDVVVNCAAMTQVDDCEDARDACWAVNVDSVDTLARLCHQHGSHLIQVSTDFVFSGDDGPYREHDRPAPVNFYGRSKLAAENATRQAGLDRWSVVRPVLIFGTGHNLSRSNIVLWVVNQLTEGKTIRVVTDQLRSPTYAPDLADGIERLIRFNKHGLFHMSGRDMVTIHDLAHRIASVYDLDHTLIQPTDSTQFTQRAARPPRTGLIILKAETELGYRPRSLDDALRHLGNRLGLPV